ncbi:MAG: hypothetical protein RR415_14710, partial [Ruthenibacterium sp.]
LELKNDLGRVGLVMLVLLLAQSLLRSPLLLFVRALGMAFGGVSTLLTQLLSLGAYLVSMLVAIVAGKVLFGNDFRFLFPTAVPRRDYQLPAVG